MKNSRGFTLIELLVVISIISVIASVVLVSLQSAREKGRVTSSIIFSDNLYQGWGAEAFGIWKFDEAGANDNATDSGPNSFTLTKATDNSTRISNSPLSNGKAISFVTSSALDAPSFVSSDISGRSLSMSKYTTSVWVYMIDTSSSQGVPVSIYTSFGRANYMNFSVISSGQLYAGPQVITCTPNTYFTYTAPIGKWVNYAYSWDGAGNTRLYIDGKYYASLTSCTTSIGAGSWIAKYIYVGNHASGGAHFVNGYIDELAIYNNVLTADVIQQIYAAGASRHYASPDNSNNLANTISSQNASISQNIGR